MVRFKKYSVVMDDTPQVIAHATTGLVSNWVAIMEYNGLEYPYIVQTSEEKLKNPDHLAMPGDVLIIPIGSLLTDIDPKELSNQEKLKVLELTLGKDLDMVADERNWEASGGSDDIMSLTHNTKGDLKTIVGVENLRQATIAKLMTEKGSLLMHPDYGSNVYNMFNKATVEQAKLIEIEICRTILTDSRITSVETIESYIDRDTYKGAFSVSIRSLEESFDILVQGDATGFQILT